MPEVSTRRVEYWSISAIFNHVGTSDTTIGPCDIAMPITNSATVSAPFSRASSSFLNQ